MFFRKKDRPPKAVPIPSQLSMLLNGVIDPQVQGGFKNYEEAFFNDAYFERQDDQSPENLVKEKAKIQRLKSLLADIVSFFTVLGTSHVCRASSKKR